MDTQLYVSTLREQSERVCELATELSANLRTLEQALNERAALIRMRISSAVKILSRYYGCVRL
jgi:hypothetical protein